MRAMMVMLAAVVMVVVVVVLLVFVAVEWLLVSVAFASWRVQHQQPPPVARHPLGA